MTETLFMMQLVTTYQLIAEPEETPIIEYTKEWVKGKMSNFDYLAIINTYSQRST